MFDCSVGGLRAFTAVQKLNEAALKDLIRAAVALLVGKSESKTLPTSSKRAVRTKVTLLIRFR